MSWNDVIGVALIILVLLAGGFGLSQLTKPRHLTEEEYERRVRESSGIAGGVMNALGEAFNPKATEAAAVQQDMRAGHYNRREEAAGGSEKESGEE
ncbi:MAG TPA: hypothetical protein VM870_03570 [Pyrinomonadaceae bacterium]|jgi:hypothetical protein|nr:hypothetical protein [Pyrinomonadaceae bacterium]